MPLAKKDHTSKLMSDLKSLEDKVKSVAETVDRIHREAREGNPLVRIHGIGFPTMFSHAGFSENTGTRNMG